MLLIVAVAGLSFLTISNTADAGHRSCRSGGHYGGGYGAPVYRSRNYYGGGHGSYYSRPSYNYYGGHSGYYGGRGGYYGRNYYGGSGFGIQTRGFGIYIR